MQEGSGKVPVSVKVVSENEATISWCLSRIDWDGEWSWLEMDGDTRERVYRLLGELESHTLKSAPKGSNEGSIKDLTNSLKMKSKKKSGPPAKLVNRLGKLEVDDHDGLWEMRVGNKGRVFFVVYRPSFCHLIWWDPNHLVWPSKKDR